METQTERADVWTQWGGQGDEWRVTRMHTHAACATASQWGLTLGLRNSLGAGTWDGG